MTWDKLQDLNGCGLAQAFNHQTLANTMSSTGSQDEPAMKQEPSLRTLFAAGFHVLLVDHDASRLVVTYHLLASCNFEGRRPQPRQMF